MGPRPHLSFCACKTTWLASELLVSTGPSPLLWLLHAKQRLLDRIYKSLWVPGLICGFCMQNSDFWISITNLYGSQTSPVDLWMQSSVLRSRMTLVYWSQSSSVVLCIHKSDIMTRINSLYGSQSSPGVLCMQNSEISIRITSLFGSQPSFVVFANKTANLGP